MIFLQKANRTCREEASGRPSLHFHIILNLLVFQSSLLKRGCDHTLPYLSTISRDNRQSSIRVKALIGRVVVVELTQLTRKEEVVTTTATTTTTCRVEMGVTGVTTSR